MMTLTITPLPLREKDNGRGGFINEAEACAK
jgi:hypothetical protein